MNPATNRFAGFVEVLRGVDLLEDAVVQHADPVAQGHGFDLVVGDVDVVTPRRSCRSGGAHRDAELGVQVGQRLVHQERLGLTDDRAAHGDTLALTAGEGGGLALEVLLEAEHRGGFPDRRLLALGILRRLQPKARFSSTVMCG